MGDSTQQQQLVASLSKAYASYKGCAGSPASVNSKVQLTSLTESLQKQGIHGGNALQLLHSLKQHIGWQAMGPDEFRRFYCFVFFLCREEGKRNVQKEVAIAAWRGLLEGRFRLLDRWCAFMSNREQYRLEVVTEDTWVQLLEFSRTVHEDLSNYDPTAAWPVALDDFVEHMRRAAKKPAEPMDLSATSWPSEPCLAAVSPRSGSKRRMPLLEAEQAAAEVAEKLQQLPLACSTTSTSGQQHQHQQHYQQHYQQQRPVSAVSRGGSGGSGGSAHHQHVVKRYRAATPPAAPAPQPPAAAAAGGSSDSLGFRPAQHQQHGASAGAAAAAAAAQHHHHSFEQQQQDYSQAMQVSSSAGFLSSHHHQQQHMAAKEGGSRAAAGSYWAEQQQAHAAGYGDGRGPSPSSSSGASSGADAYRCNNSVTALVQATVTDTLFYTH